jgi:hypothetical protein
MQMSEQCYECVQIVICKQFSVVLIEAIEDQTIRDPDVVRKAAVAFDLVRGDALPRGASQDMILKVAEDKWNV